MNHLLLAHQTVPGFCIVLKLMSPCLVLYCAVLFTATDVFVVSSSTSFAADVQNAAVLLPNVFMTWFGHTGLGKFSCVAQNVVLYNGSAVDRELIRDHEFRYKSTSSLKGKTVRQAPGQFKFNVLLASYEMVRKDKKVFQDIPWETVIIDEAHRLKNTTSDTRAAVAGMDIQWLLLLTGQHPIPWPAVTDACTTASGIVTLNKLQSTSKRIHVDLPKQHCCSTLLCGTSARGHA